MDFELYSEPSKPSFATDVGKTFVLSAVAVVGTMFGLAVCVSMGDWAKRRRKKRENEAKEATQKK